ncbi:sucrase ferredoxin [Ktedonospora formicarum]|uniref:Sucrase ferredoxin n=1 Tax=Ktedonospora formicarum TaxID=2778364 RepID=A0A8J3IA19_9CHLR|nr:sucrase ferredoxin [Ktedonospora formicarum]GHO48259.1 sucrase ferredoxin [Ktedonospora formicarum]
MREEHFCAHISEVRQDPFIGLATPADLWLMVEYTGPWEYMSVYNNKLPEHVREWLKAIANDYMNLKTIVTFIRKDMRPLGRIRCFVGVTREEREAIYAFNFASYEEIPKLDLEALRTGSPEYDAYLSSDPMYLVCTNGKHDMCCARFGIPVHREASRIDSEHTWHCTHIGWDQFAANFLCLPHGVYYSRVTVPEVASIIEADRARRLYTRKCRGRTIYSYAVQAAEHYIREHTGETRMDALRLLDSTTEAEGRDTVRFQATSDGTIYRVTIQFELQQPEMPPCRCDAEGKNLRYHFHLQTFEELQPA